MFNPAVRRPVNPVAAGLELQAGIESDTEFLSELDGFNEQDATVFRLPLAVRTTTRAIRRHRAAFAGEAGGQSFLARIRRGSS